MQNNEIMKIIRGSGIYKDIRHKGSYFLLFGTRKLQDFQIIDMTVSITLKQASLF